MRPSWKAGLYDLEVVLLWGHYFQMGGLAYDNEIECCVMML